MRIAQQPECEEEEFRDWRRISGILNGVGTSLKRSVSANEEDHRMPWSRNMRWVAFAVVVFAVVIGAFILSNPLNTAEDQYAVYAPVVAVAG